MESKLLRHFVVGITCFLCGPVQAFSDDDFRISLEAARDGHFSKVAEESKSHVLAPYIEFHRLRTGLPNTTPQDVLSFADAHRDKPLGRWLINQAITSYEKTHRWPDLLAVSPKPPRSAEGQCAWYRAQLINDQALAFEGGRSLWLSGQSRPEECDDLFKAMAAKGALGPELHYQRLLLALAANNGTLAGYLTKKLSASGWPDVAAFVKEAMSRPEALRHIPEKVAGQADPVALTVALMSYQAPRNMVKAMAVWNDIKAQREFPEFEASEIERRLAANTFRLSDEQRDEQVNTRLKTLGSAEWIGPALRDAIAAGDWPAVLDWIAAVRGNEQTSSYMQYWKARALESLGRNDEAQPHYQSAATVRDFYGFLAAEKLGVPYSLNSNTPDVTPEQLVSLQQEPAVKRIEALINISEGGLALEELSWMVTLKPQLSAPFAEYALQKGWPSLAVQTTILGSHWDYVQHRFPSAYQDQFRHVAAELKLDPLLLMSIARRESSFNEYAQSHVGARGLMQLMPATAQQVAGSIKMPYKGQNDLFREDVNIRLGSTYMRTLLNRFDGNVVAALASYNAGPHRVVQWLKTPSGSYDQFIESIPFKETREYVKAVLAYRVIFNSLNGQQISEVLSPTERGMSRYLTSTEDGAPRAQVAN